ncbi:MAG: hypothetical protein MUO30_02245 [Anaerolineales bacterium]|nr:hypothetical protein [Anaerolineales bacterium]
MGEEDGKYKGRLREKIEVLLDEIERVNEQEKMEYGNDDLEEMGGKGDIDAEKLKAKVTGLNKRLRQQPGNKPLKEAAPPLANSARFARFGAIMHRSPSAASQTVGRSINRVILRVMNCRKLEK